MRKLKFSQSVLLIGTDELTNETIKANSLKSQVCKPNLIKEQYTETFFSQYQWWCTLATVTERLVRIPFVCWVFPFMLKLGPSSDC